MLTSWNSLDHLRQTRDSKEKRLKWLVFVPFRRKLCKPSITDPEATVKHSKYLKKYIYIFKNLRKSTAETKLQLINVSKLAKTQRKIILTTRWTQFAFWFNRIYRFFSLFQAKSSSKFQFRATAMLATTNCWWQAFTDLRPLCDIWCLSLILSVKLSRGNQASEDGMRPFVRLSLSVLLHNRTCGPSVEGCLRPFRPGSI